jgi:hypothetical protein
LDRRRRQRHPRAAPLPAQRSVRAPRGPPRRRPLKPRCSLRPPAAKRGWSEASRRQLLTILTCAPAPTSIGLRAARAPTLTSDRARSRPG